MHKGYKLIEACMPIAAQQTSLSRTKGYVNA